MKIFDALKEINIKTGIKFDVITLDNRIFFQKTVFLLKYFNFKGARKYDFNIYLHGPYSADLAHEYLIKGRWKLRYAKSKNQVNDNTIELIKQILLKFDDPKKEIKFLEALTTLLSLSSEFNLPVDALFKAKTLKPYMEDSIWEESINFININKIWKPN